MTGETMRTMVLDSVDGPARFRAIQVPRPTAAPTEVVVRVDAVGTNPVEWGAHPDGWLAALHGGFPLRLGWDVAGEVVEVGVGVTRLQPGGQVFGLPRFPHPAGGYGEYVSGPSRHFVRVPSSLPAIQAAGLPISGLTAWQALVDVANVQPGERVLVTAAAGGVGHLAVQIARARGAHVIASARAAKHEFVRALGANEAVDYTTGGLADVGTVDVVVDLVGGAGMGQLVPLLGAGGRMVSVAGAVPDDLHRALVDRGATATLMLVEPDQAGLAALAELVAAGALRVEVAAVYPLEEVAAAHDLGRSGQTVGKIVLAVDH